MNKNILLSIPVACILLLGCSDESKNEAKEVANTAIDKVANTTNTTTKKVTEVVQEVKKEAEPIINNVVEASTEVVTKATKSATQMKESVQKKIHKATAPAVDGKALYSRCGSCHGQNGERKALNASKIIQGWSKEQVLSALKGYKDGTYGGAMKGVMVGQVKSFDDTQLDALATYIASL